MNHIFRPQTWPFFTQLGVFTLATAVASSLVVRLVGWSTPATAAHPVWLVGLVGTVGLALCLFRSLMQQGKRVASMVKHIAVSQAASHAAIGNRGPGDHRAGSLRPVLEQTLGLIQRQAGHIAESTATLDQLAASIQQAAESASCSATVTEQGLMNAQQGTTAVADTIHGIQYIGIQGLDVARRLQHLEEHAQEVDTIGHLIGDLADRTSVLALNVSVQATKAGPVGQDCVIAAAEVEHLSGRTTDATKRIAYVAHTMRRETHEVVTALEESTHEMAQWVQTAAQVGQSLKESEGVSSHVAELIQSLVLETTQQSLDVATLAKTMAALSAVTHQAMVGTKQVGAALDDLLTLADH